MQLINQAVYHYEERAFSIILSTVKSKPLYLGGLYIDNPDKKQTDILGSCIQPSLKTPDLGSYTMDIGPISLLGSSSWPGPRRACVGPWRETPRMWRTNNCPAHVLWNLVKFDSWYWRILVKLDAGIFASSRHPRQNFPYLFWLFRYTEVAGYYAQNFPSMPDSKIGIPWKKREISTLTNRCNLL